MNAPLEKELILDSSYLEFTFDGLFIFINPGSVIICIKYHRCIFVRNSDNFLTSVINLKYIFNFRFVMSDPKNPYTFHKKNVKKFKTIASLRVYGDYFGLGRNIDVLDKLLLVYLVQRIEMCRKDENKTVDYLGGRKF